MHIQLIQISFSNSWYRVNCPKKLLAWDVVCSGLRCILAFMHGFTNIRTIFSKILRNILKAIQNVISTISIIIKLYSIISTLDENNTGNILLGVVVESLLDPFLNDPSSVHWKRFM
jgi:hypothetical protein